MPTKKFGGEYLVRAGEYKVIDGDGSILEQLIKFPTYEKALEWYDSDQCLAKME